MSDNNDSWSFTDACPDATDDYRLGFELGAMWQRMMDGWACIGTEANPCHVSKANMPAYKSMAAHYGYRLLAVENDTGTMTTTFWKPVLATTRLSLIPGGKHGD